VVTSTCLPVQAPRYRSLDSPHISNTSKRIDIILYLYLLYDLLSVSLCQEETTTATTIEAADKALLVRVEILKVVVEVGDMVEDEDEDEDEVAGNIPTMAHPEEAIHTEKQTLWFKSGKNHKTVRGGHPF
jgi:hypothetical protein